MTKYWTIFIIMAFSVFTGIWYLSRPRFCYVNLKEVFENFTFTKKLRGDLKMVKSARIRQLDSLHFELELISKKLNSKYSTELATLFQKKRNEYITTEEEILASNSTLTQQYDDQIHAQMESYLVDFGKENNYDMVFGTESLGTILYARDRFDATLEATIYINNRFSSNIK
jgi:Skp family chaperone for outer membrane proteins